MRYFLAFFLLFFFVWNGGQTRSGEMVRTETIYHDDGGMLSVYNARLRQYQSTNTHLIFAGDCYSACTRFMKVQNVCAMPGAYFYFHAANINGRAAVRASMLDSLMNELPQAFEIQDRYKVWWFGLVKPKVKPANRHLEPDIDLIYDEVRTGVYQKWLRVRAVRLIRPC